MAFLFVCVGAHLSRRWRILTKSCSSSSAALRCNLSRRWWKSAVERSFCTSTWRTLPVFFWKMEARRRLKVGSFSRAAHRRACSSSSAWEDPIADSRGLPPPKMLKFAVPVDRLKLEDRKSALVLLDNDRELRRLRLERIACNLSVCSSPTSGSRSFSSFPPFVNSISLTSSSTNFTSCWYLSFQSFFGGFNRLSPQYTTCNTPWQQYRAICKWILYSLPSLKEVTMTSLQSFGFNYSALLKRPYLKGLWRFQGMRETRWISFFCKVKLRDSNRCDACKVELLPNVELATCKWICDILTAKSRIWQSFEVQLFDSKRVEKSFANKRFQ